VDKKKGLPKTADFKCAFFLRGSGARISRARRDRAIGKAIYASFKNKDVLAPKEQTAA